MPMPKPVCRTDLYNKIVQLEVCRTFSGRGTGINGTAHYIVSGWSGSTRPIRPSCGGSRPRVLGGKTQDLKIVSQDPNLEIKIDSYLKM